jgi:tetratricopeptide (TPR) repeat protein
MRTLFIILVCIATTGLAQENRTDLSFDKKYYEAVDQWVAFPKSEKDSTFFYGFIYLDEQAGFTYQFGSTFKIDSSGNFKPEPIDSTLNAKYRIEPNWKPVAIIPQEKRAELNLPAEPDWLKIYKENSGSVSYLKNIGYHYNHVGACKLALEPLLKAYKIEPHFEGLEFELSYAYNHLGEFEKAIPILDKAIDNNPANFYLYRELGYAYVNLSRIDEAEATYRTGIDKSNNDFEKSEMAVNMAQAYFQLRNKEKFDEWAELTKKYAEKDSRYAQYIDHFEQNWDNN